MYFVFEAGNIESHSDMHFDSNQFNGINVSGR